MIPVGIKEKYTFHIAIKYIKCLHYREIVVIFLPYKSMHGVYCSWARHRMFA